MVVAFIGPVRIYTMEMKRKVTEVVEDLIVNSDADSFLFGDISSFDYFSHVVVSELKKKYPHIRRIYVRSDSKMVSAASLQNLYRYYECVCYSPLVDRENFLSYDNCKCLMVDLCDVLLTYIDDESKMVCRSTLSDMQVPVERAMEKNRRVINIAELLG